MIEIFGPKILENFQNPFCKVFFKKSHDSQAFPPIDKSPTIPFNKALLHIPTYYMFFNCSTLIAPP